MGALHSSAAEGAAKDARNQTFLMLQRLGLYDTADSLREASQALLQPGNLAEIGKALRTQGIDALDTTLQENVSELSGLARDQTDRAVNRVSSSVARNAAAGGRVGGRNAGLTSFRAETEGSAINNLLGISVAKTAQDRAFGLQSLGTLLNTNQGFINALVGLTTGVGGRLAGNLGQIASAAITGQAAEAQSETSYITSTFGVGQNAEGVGSLVGAIKGG